MSGHCVMGASLAALILFLAAVGPSQGQATPGPAHERHVTAVAGRPLLLECPVRVEAAAAWRREGRPLPAAGEGEGEVEGELRAAGERPAADGRVLARLAAPRAAPAHAGRYTCGPAPDQALRLTVLETTSGAETAGGGGAGDSGAGAEFGEIVYYDVGHAIELNCDIPNPDNEQIVWSKNGTAISSLWDVAGRARLEGPGGARLVLPAKTHEDDYGNYSCVAGGARSGRQWRLQGRPHSKLPANTNVVEGQKVKLQCRVYGKPYPPVTWVFYNASSGDENGTDALAALGARGSLAASEQGVAGAALLLAEARRSDAGRYECRVAADPALNGATTLRVKDMYAALWPFLGICAEVLVLCAVILVYERRRSKPELDDSDTDNHEQKKS